MGAAREFLRRASARCLVRSAVRFGSGARGTHTGHHQGAATRRHAPRDLARWRTIPWVIGVPPGADELCDQEPTTEEGVERVEPSGQPHRIDGIHAGGAGTQAREYPKTEERPELTDGETQEVDPRRQ